MIGLSRRELLTSAFLAAGPSGVFWSSSARAQAGPVDGATTSVATELAKGALQYIGGKIAEQQLHDYGIVRKPDLIKKLGPAVRQIVREEIERALSTQELAQLNGEVNAVMTDLQLLLNLRKPFGGGVSAVLGNALSKLSYVIERSSDHKYFGAHVLASAFSLRLIALRLQFRQNSDIGIFLAMSKEIEANTARIIDAVSEYRGLMWAEKRLSILACGSHDIPHRSKSQPDISPSVVHICSFGIDGVVSRDTTFSSRISAGDATSKANAARGSAFRRLKKAEGDGERLFSRPLLTVVDEWTRAKRKIDTLVDRPKSRKI